MSSSPPAALKTCSRCGLVKLLTEFPLKNRRSTLLQSHCRSCKARYQREWYQRNRARHIRNVAARNRRHRARNRAIVEEAKNLPCADCGRRFPPFVMDFDHVRGEKLWNIAEMWGRATEPVLRAEIAKCEVVCANCHRLRTYGPGVVDGEAGAEGRDSGIEASEGRASYVIGMTRQVSCPG
ncbi:MAG: hypothetical protein WD080_09315 [Egibacteraceae bacterium]